ncbi:MAG: HAD family hydrolase [Proteobacteria bacterium]|nr:HAD family hydrolase [Pseudomonadota bacterium]
MSRFPKAVLFDLDDTLIAAYGRPERAWQAVVAEFDGALGPESTVVAGITRAARAFWEDPERHRIWRQKIEAARRAIVLEAFRRMKLEGLPAPDEALQVRLADRFSAYRNENLRLFPDTLATLEAVRKAGVRLALITNGASTHQRAKIVRFDLARHFDHIQIEGEHGFGKPEERAYRHALSVLDAQPAETWIVGDNLEWEVVAPGRLGLTTIWFDPNGDGLPPGHHARPHRIVRSLTELLG